MGCTALRVTPVCKNDSYYVIIRVVPVLLGNRCARLSITGFTPQRLLQLKGPYIKGGLLTSLVPWGELSLWWKKTRLLYLRLLGIPALLVKHREK